jgi:hypothetical protein
MDTETLKSAYRDGLINGFADNEDKYALMNLLLTFGRMTVLDFMDFEEQILVEQLNSI